MKQKEQWESWILDYLGQRLEWEERLAFENYLKEDEEFAKTFRVLKQIYSFAQEESELEAPAELRRNFQAVLQEELQKQTQRKKGWEILPWDTLWPLQIISRVVMVILFLWLGFLWGSNQEEEGLADLQNNVAQLQLSVAHLQLKSQSPADRIQGLRALFDKSEEPEMIDLFTRKMTYDESLQVRLEAAQYLLNVKDQQIIMDAFVQNFRQADNLLTRSSFLAFLLELDTDLAKMEVAQIPTEDVTKGALEELLIKRLETKGL